MSAVGRPTVKEAKVQVMVVVHKLARGGVLTATGGNVSALADDGAVVVTPSAVDYAEMGIQDLAVVAQDGRRLEGPYTPSTEVPMHLGVYRSRQDVGGIVHTHSPYATGLACAGQEIPPIHYMLTTICPNGRIPVAPYTLYGTERLGEVVVDTIGATGHGCLLANHGALTVGPSVRQAGERALTLEEMAAIYHHAIMAGNPVCLSLVQVEEVAQKIAGYRAILTASGAQASSGS